MRKGWMVLLAMALVVALAVPASAEMKLTGFYRVRPTVSNFVGNGNMNLDVPGTDPAVTGAAASPHTSLVKFGSAGVETDRTRAFTEMRNRLRFEIGDENVKGVTFFELDGNFGDRGGNTGRNQGFAANGDSINLETKNAFVWFKVPDTNLSFTVGLQNYTDEFAGLMFGASDQAGVVANFKYEPVTFRFTWFKLADDISGGGPANNAWTSNNAGGKEADYYALDAKFNATKDVGAFLHFGLIRDRKVFSTVGAAFIDEAATYTSMSSYYTGAGVSFNVAPVSASAYLVYNFGEFKKTGAENVKIGGFAGGLRADANLGPGKAFLEGLYVSGDDNCSDKKYKSVITGSDYANLTSFYVRPDMYILFPQADMINSATALVLNPNNNGRGLMLLAVGYSQKFSDKVSGKLGAGYLTADKKRIDSVVAKGKAMGTEINANVNYNITKGLDFGVFGAYCMLGSFYDRTAPESNPSDLYELHGRLNYAF